MPHLTHIEDLWAIWLKSVELLDYRVKRYTHTMRPSMRINLQIIMKNRQKLALTLPHRRVFYRNFKTWYDNGVLNPFIGKI